MSIFGFIPSPESQCTDLSEFHILGKVLRSDSGLILGHSAPGKLNNVQAIHFNGMDLLWMGRLDNLNELSKEYSVTAPTSVEQLAKLIVNHGDTAIPKMIGEFVFATWNQGRRELRLYRDRIGAKPIYFNHGKNGLAFATQAKIILQLTKMKIEPDQTGLAGHLTSAVIDQFAYGRTCFKDIEALPPAHFLQWQNGQSPKIRSYWDFQYNSDLENIDFIEATQEFARLFHQSVARRSQRPTAISVSGGLDSSSILCSLLSGRAQAPLKRRT